MFLRSRLLLRAQQHPRILGEFCTGQVTPQLPVIVLFKLVFFSLCVFIVFLRFLIPSFLVKDPARELLRLQLLLEKKDQELARGRLELEKKELEWRMRELHANGVDQTGGKTITRGNISDMETSQLNRSVFY